MFQLISDEGFTAAISHVDGLIRMRILSKPTRRMELMSSTRLYKFIDMIPVESMMVQLGYVETFKVL